MSPFSECRAFLANLEAHALEGIRESGELPPHPASCESCRRRLGAAARQIGWLGRALSVEPPDELQSAVALERVYDRALEQLDDEPGRDGVKHAIRAAMQPVTAPEDPDLVAVFEAGDNDASLRDGLERNRAPGWLWSTIRSDIDQFRRTRRARLVRRRLLQTGIAAGMLVALWFGVNRGTTPAPEIVIVELADPPLLDFSPVGLLEDNQRR